MLEKIAAGAAGIALMVAAGSAWAVDVKETVTIAAPPAKVWGVMGDFDSIAKWHPAAATSPADKGNTVGSVRVITLRAPGDPTITEQLTAFDGSGHSYSYKILKVDPKVLPVTNYTSTVALMPMGNTTMITWTGHFDAAGGADDAAAGKAIAGVYRGGLDNIKVLAEK